MTHLPDGLYSLPGITHPLSSDPLFRSTPQTTPPSSSPHSSRKKSLIERIDQLPNHLSTNSLTSFSPPHLTYQFSPRVTHKIILPLTQTPLYLLDRPNTL